jgi:hypothetical protein
VRLSVKKAAYADVSRAAYRKSGVVLGELDHTGMLWQSSKANPILSQTTDCIQSTDYLHSKPDLVVNLDSSGLFRTLLTGRHIGSTIYTNVLFLLGAWGFNIRLGRNFVLQVARFPKASYHRDPSRL